MINHCKAQVDHFISLDHNEQESKGPAHDSWVEEGSSYGKREFHTPAVGLDALRTSLTESTASKYVKT